MTYRLSCPSQKYAWGKVGQSSLVGQLCSQTPENVPYAELWMGTHPSGPAKVNNQLLSEFLKESKQDHLGIPNNTCELPFLLKVLSVNTALSIQAHPDTTLAQKLHKSDPINYKDPNHKPEICVALGTFEAFCGFQKCEEISSHLSNVQELGDFVGQDVVKLFQAHPTQENLKILFGAWMKADKQSVAKSLESLLSKISQKTDPTVLETLVMRLNHDYPMDVGCFAPFFLNYCIMQDGDSLFMGPNEPHAYIHGECIECMSCSDNVVRAGLTPKFRDTDVLINMLTYDDESLAKNILKPKEINEQIKMYAPPIDEFMVLRVQLSEEKTNVKLPCASIFIVIEGSGKATVQNSKTTQLKLSRGDVYFCEKDSNFEFSSHEKLQVFVASYNKI